MRGSAQSNDRVIFTSKVVKNQRRCDSHLLVGINNLQVLSRNEKVVAVFCVCQQTDRQTDTQTDRVKDWQ